MNKMWPISRVNQFHLCECLGHHYYDDDRFENNDDNNNTIKKYVST